MPDEKPDLTGNPDVRPEVSDAVLREQYIKLNREDFKDNRLMRWSTFNVREGRRYSLREELRRERSEEINGQPADTREDWIERQLDDYRSEVAADLFLTRVTPDDPLLYGMKAVMASEDYDAIRESLINRINDSLQEKRVPRILVRGVLQEFEEDRKWLNSWGEYFEAHPGDAKEVVKPATGPSFSGSPEPDVAESVASDGAESRSAFINSAREKAKQSLDDLNRFQREKRRNGGVSLRDWVQQEYREVIKNQTKDEREKFIVWRIDACPDQETANKEIRDRYSQKTGKNPDEEMQKFLDTFSDGFLAEYEKEKIQTPS